MRAAPRRLHALRAPSSSSATPYIPWLYQAAVRTFRADLYGDDLSFIQAGLPALFVSDSSFSAFYPWYHQPADTADKLDPAALGRMGEGVLAILRDLEAAPRSAPSEPNWFAAFGRVVGPVALFALAAASILPGLRLGFRLGGKVFAVRLAGAALFGYVFFKHPVPMLFMLLLPNLLPLAPRRAWTLAIAVLPVLALLGLGSAAWYRGFVHGVWLSYGDIGAAVAAFGFALVPAGGGSGSAAGKLGKPGKSKRRDAPRITQARRRWEGTRP